MRAIVASVLLSLAWSAPFYVIGYNHGWVGALEFEMRSSEGARKLHQRMEEIEP